MQPPFSRHAGFFASLHRVERRLASEQRQEEDEQQHRPFYDTVTASPLLLLDDPDPAAPPAAATAAYGESSGPALDLLTLTTCGQADPSQAAVADDDDDDIERLMALLGLSPPRNDGGGGCDCSGPDGFMAKVVGVVGPKCDREHGRLDAWIHHYHRRGRREPARLAHLLLAKASGDTGAAFPATVKGFLDRDAPPEEDHVM